MNTLVKTEKNISKYEIREKILDFESMLMEVPGAVFGDNDLFPVKHYFADRIYTREMFIPKTGLLTGRIWKYEFPCYVLKGELVIASEFGEKIFKAPCSFISKPGAKRVIYAKEDSVLTTIHYNPDNIKDKDILLDRMTSENYEEYEKFIKRKSTNSGRINNCGLNALKKIKDIKSSSMRSLIDIAEDNGLSLYPYMVSDGKELMSIPLPAIVHSENHFDYILNEEDFDFNKEYTGYVLLTQKSDYKKIKNSELKNIKGETGLIIGIIGAVGAIGAASINAASKNTTECGKECRAKCKIGYSFFDFSSKNKCKKDCKTKCMNQSNEPPVSSAKKAQTNTMTYILVVAIIISIIGLIFWALRKK